VGGGHGGSGKVCAILRQEKWRRAEVLAGSEKQLQATAAATRVAASRVPDDPMNPLEAETWLSEHGDYLFRVARRQLHSDELAEDAVQETLLAALSARERFAGAASPRTWLTAILKHKIVDLIRRSVREVQIPVDEDGEEAVDALFKRDGHWVEPLRPWGNPESEAELGQLRRVLDDCASRLKPVMAQVFSLREVAGMETAEICKELDITPTNCWVLLHRARMFLRECLEMNGFSGAVS
jgi:RNA polymerase sigma-70 factor (ECF subfamily)